VSSWCRRVVMPEFHSPFTKTGAGKRHCAASRNCFGGFGGFGQLSGTLSLNVPFSLGVPFQGFSQGFCAPPIRTLPAFGGGFFFGGSGYRNPIR